jgi:REP element-mobilizing transposase RayT
MTRSRYRIYEDYYPYFLTCTVVGWLPVFTRPETVQILYDSWAFLQRERRLLVYGYVILENHLHLIASAPNLFKEIGDFKSFTARQIIDHLEVRNVRTLLKWLRLLKARHKTDRTHQLWQEGSHPQQIQNEAIMRQKLEYMHCNPVARGYVDEPTHWRHSSARNYAGMAGLFPVQTEW